MANFSDMEKRHQAFFNSVMKAMTWGGAAVIALVAVMAVTLIRHP